MFRESFSKPSLQIRLHCVVGRGDPAAVGLAVGGLGATVQQMPVGRFSYELVYR